MNHPHFELSHSRQQLFAWAHLQATPAIDEVNSGPVFSHARYPILRHDRAGHREIVWMRQGLIPAYAHDDEGAEDRADAHAESLTCTSCYRSAFRRRRCIVPADKVTGLHDGPDSRAGLSSLSLERGGIFGLGGVWETWENENGHAIQTFAIITLPAPPPLRQIADRVPVILSAQDQDRWLHTSDFEHPPIDLVRGLGADELRDWQVVACSLAPGTAAT